MKIEKISNIWKGVALIILNTLVLIIILNSIIFLSVLILKDKFVVGPITFSDEAKQEIYPNLTRNQIDILLRETYQIETDLGKINKGYDYEPFTGFKERPRNGMYVNIDQNGFRIIKNQCFFLNEEKYNCKD